MTVLFVYSLNFGGIKLIFPFVKQLSPNPQSAKTRKIIETKLLYYNVPIVIYAKFGPEILATNRQGNYRVDTYHMCDKYGMRVTCRVYPSEIEKSPYKFLDPYVENNLKKIVIDNYESEFKNFIEESKEKFGNNFEDRYQIKLDNIPNPEIEFHYIAHEIEPVFEEQEPYYLTTFNY